jgi:hypothetical protein
MRIGTWGYRAAVVAGSVFLVAACDSGKSKSSADLMDVDAGTSAVADGAVVPMPSGMTYYQNVAPILQKSCAGCHKAGGIGPFDITSYEQAKKFAEAAVEAIDEGRMPPWSAQETSECKPLLPWKDDLRVVAADLAVLKSWLASGTQAGDPTKAAVLTAAPTLELKDANVRVSLPAPVQISGTEDQFICFSLDPKITQDVWLNGTQITAGNAAIVHHVLLYADPKGESAALAGAKGNYPCFGGPGISGSTELIGAWAPGALPSTTPPSVGILLKAGSRVIMNVHYHPTGGAKVETDSATSMDLRWSTTVPENAGRLSLIGNFGSADMQVAGGKGYGLLPSADENGSAPKFHIPAGAAKHVESMRFKVPGNPAARAAGIPIRIWTVGTHMHYLGQDMKIDLVRPIAGDRPASECLLQTPKWNFEWQRGYTYDAPLDKVPGIYPGDELNFRCTFDNSMNNAALRKVLGSQGKTAPIDVDLGEGTLNEMCLGVFGISVPQRFAGTF